MHNFYSINIAIPFTLYALSIIAFYIMYSIHQLQTQSAHYYNMYIKTFNKTHN